MNTFLKIIGLTLGLAVITTAAILLYFFRSQTLDLSQYMPPKMTLCNKIIIKTDQEYIELHSWLKNNQKDWSATVVSYVPMYVYKAESIQINVMDGGIVVNYMSGDSWSQVVKQTKTNSLGKVCK